MTRFSDLLEKEHELISYESIQELLSNGMSLRIIVHGSANATDLLIYPQSSVTRYQIDFPSYASYSVTFEDFTTWNDTESYTGHSFRTYSKSDYFEYLQKTGHLPREYRGKPCKHYGLSCIEHLVHILSYEEPKITVGQVGAKQT